MITCAPIAFASCRAKIDTPPGALYENGLSGEQPRVEQRVPGGDPRTGEGCNFEIAQVRGRQGEGVRVHEQMLLRAAIGVTAQRGSNGLLRGATADPARKEVGRHAGMPGRISCSTKIASYRVSIRAPARGGDVYLP